MIKLNPPGVGSKFGGGWDSPRTTMMMPLSPNYMLYTEVGVRRPMQDQCLSVEQARWFNRLTAEHAYRAIYAQHPNDHIESLRRREVNAVLYERERKAWRDFHDSQTTAEWDMLTHPITDFPKRT